MDRNDFDAPVDAMPAVLVIAVVMLMFWMLT